MVTTYFARSRTYLQLELSFKIKHGYNTWKNAQGEKQVGIALQNQARLQLEIIGNIHKDSWNCASILSTVTTSYLVTFKLG